MTIYWNTDVNAPCCLGEIVDSETGESLLIQRDWDYPGVANTFGWSVDHVQRCPECGEPQQRGYICEDCESPMLYCAHEQTDGTVDCPDCGVSAGDFIGAAGDWLRDNDGAEVDDPGYFPCEA